MHMRLPTDISDRFSLYSIYDKVSRISTVHRGNALGLSCYSRKYLIIYMMPGDHSSLFCKLGPLILTKKDEVGPSFFARVKGLCPSGGLGTSGAERQHIARGETAKDQAWLRSVTRRIAGFAAAQMPAIFEAPWSKKLSPSAPASSE